jgi:hypothetical protein
MDFQMDLIGLDKVARETIGRLSRSKREFAARVDTLQSMLSESAPASDLAAVRNSLELYTAKTRLLIERENQWIEDRTRRDLDRVELIAAKEKIEDLKMMLFEAQEQVGKS